MISPNAYIYLVTAPLFLVLGVFIIANSRKYKVFNLTWAGFFLVGFSIYFFGVLLNYFGLIIGIWNLFLQAFQYVILFFCLIFTRETFYKYKPKRVLIVVACVTFTLGIVCSTFSLFGDTSLPYNEIFDEFDAWRFFLYNFIIIPTILTPLLIATWREFKRARPSETILSIRFLLYFTSLLTSIASSILYVIGIMITSLYSIFIILVVFTGLYSAISLYLVWISPETGKHGNMAMKTSKELENGSIPVPETIITSVAIYRVIENLGAALAGATGKSLHACSGLLLLLIQKELGDESLHSLDLAKLVPLFEGPLLRHLTSLEVTDPDAAVAVLKARVADQYAVYSLHLF